MDIGLQGSVNGIEAARKIPQKYSIPLIFIPAYPSEKILNEMTEVAPKGVIQKPFMDTDLLKLVQTAMGKNCLSLPPAFSSRFLNPSPFFFTPR